jgi:hypothetical protein
MYYTRDFQNRIELGHDAMVYLCVTDGNYCHAVFTMRAQAELFCAKHPTYHVTERTLNQD